MICSICINTHKRPELLKKLLFSIFNQVKVEHLDLEIVVVENDNFEVSKYVIDEFIKKNNTRINYFLQPIKNISITRNKAVHAARGEFVFFVDDDEYADPNWIYNSVECLIKYNADAVFGPVISYFDEIVPKYIRKNKLFHRVIQETGTIPKYTRTGNCLIKTSVLKSIEGPFDIDYGVTGGSDSHLFSILQNKGAKFVYCKEAVVYEYVPTERANIKWLFLRSLRTGNSFARRSIEMHQFPLFQRIYLFGKAFLLGLLNILIAFFTFFNISLSTSFFVKSAGYLGHISAVFKIYRNEYK